MAPLAGAPHPAQRAAGITVQCKRAWEEHYDSALVKRAEFAILHTDAINGFNNAMNELQVQGQAADLGNPEPHAPSATQANLAVRAQGLYEWMKEVNSTSAGKLYEMARYQYHRTQTNRTVFAGISNTDDPDFYVHLQNEGHVRAEEAKLVSVKDESQVKAQMQSARSQLEKRRADKDPFGNDVTQWKTSVRIRSEENAWPGSESNPATANNFLDKITDQLLWSTDWIAKDREHTLLTIENVNDPGITVDQHRLGTRRDNLRIEAMGWKSTGSTNKKTQRNVWFQVLDTTNGFRSEEFHKTFDPTLNKNRYTTSNMNVELDYEDLIDYSEPMTPFNEY